MATTAGLPCAHLQPGHDPIAIVHLLRLLHGPEAAFDHRAFRLPLLRGFIEHISPCVDALHRAGVGSMKRPERSLVRKECAMAHPDWSFARVHRAHLAPGLAIVFAHTKPRFLSVGVFPALVVAEGGVEPALVKAKRHTMQEAVAVLVELVALDDGEPRVLEHRQFSGFEQRLALVPECARQVRQPSRRWQR